MTKKDYELIAGVIAGLKTEAERYNVSGHFAEALRSTNPLFDKDRFVKACKVPFGSK